MLQSGTAMQKRITTAILCYAIPGTLTSDLLMKTNWNVCDDSVYDQKFICTELYMQQNRGFTQI